ncbi:diguanylate cyclase [Trichormus sp. NMC-1]|uniref:diguanylate cyclase domain-containing protein n=1 Tax=Trichormus sp. NMC-1 TaxID=1853259 RepID=UPI0008DC10B4
MKTFPTINREITQISFESLQLMECLPVGVCYLQRDGIVSFWNSCLENWTNISREEILGKNLFLYFPHLNCQNYVEQLNQTLQSGKVTVFSPQLYPHFLTCLTKEGRFRSLQVTATPIVSTKNTGFDALLCMQEITNSLDLCHQCLTAQNLQPSQVTYPQMFEKNRAVQILIDPLTLEIFDANPAASQFYGYGREVLQQKKLSDLTVLVDGSPLPKKAVKQFAYPGNFLYFHQLASGEIRQVEIYSSRINIERKNLLYCIISDLTERLQVEATLRQANSELRRLVNLDGLTQIANRRCFDAVINLEWQRLQREKTPLSLILCDIDYFKSYNDCYGHPAGDECLRKIAQAIARTCKRPADLVARYGGEEFAVLLPNTPLEGAVYFAQQIQQQIASLSIPHHHSSVSDYVTLSMGIASMVPVPDYSLEYLIKNADISLYAAKNQGRNTYSYQLTH